MKQFVQLCIKRSLLMGVFLLFAGKLFAYTAPTALRVLWLETGGTDQTSTCHDYGDYITNVTFAGINNTTAGSGAKAWHSDFGRSPQIAAGEVTIGQSYSFSVTLAGSDYSFDYVAVYVDWNQNNTNGVSATMTLDTNENPLKWFNLTGSGTKTLTGTITVPTGIATGQVYMRVMVDADSGGGTGGDFTCGVGYGEFQDYVLNVSAASVAPTVTTQAVSSITATTATGNGNITSLGSPNPTVSGICWNISTSPTTSNFKTTNGPTGVTGAFTGSMTSLSANTTYHVKAYATNTAGTSYGAETDFTTLTAGTFTAATNNDWATASNWASNSVPTSATDVTIPSGKNPVISATTQASCNNLIVTGSLTIQSSASGTGSLIVSGTSTGTVTAERYMTGNAWHVVSPIAAFGSISTFIQTSGNAIPLKNVSGTNRYGMMDYNETTNTWNTYYAATTPDILPAGKGYSVRRASDGIVTFTGDLTSGTKLVWLGKEGMGWNCIGNPYTSAINMNDAANTSYNFLKTNAIDNTSTLDPSYACMYLWDDATLSYKILGNVSFGTRDLAQNVLQAGQGFFVKAASDGVLVQFTNNMQVHQTATPFKAPAVTTSWPGIALNAASADASSTAIITFNRNMTNGLDPTYDAGLLRGTNGLSLYTRLLEDNGVDFAIQCLPENYNNLVIPVGVDCKDGGEITFNAQTVDLPAACNVILEDRTTKTFTTLTGGATYKTTVLAGTTDIGRFYIRTGDNFTTGTSGLTAAICNLKAYTVNGAIIIEGEVSDQAIATLYDLQGLKVLVHSLQKGSLNILSCPDLMNGIYLLTIQQTGEIVTRKLIMK